MEAKSVIVKEWKAKQSKSLWELNQS